MSTPGLTPRRGNVSERLEAWVRRSVARRGAFPFLAGATALIAASAGLIARLTDPDDFRSYGDALWWSLVTLTTVGYGDIVPHSAWGRVLGGFVMILGVTFLSFLTATVTSFFISSEEIERESRTLGREGEVRAALQRIEERLAAIEARLAAQS